MILTKHKKLLPNKIEVIKLYVSIYCLLSNIKMNDVQLTVMAYYINYGIKRSTKDLIIKSKILANINCLANVMTSLRRKELIISDEENRAQISPNLRVQPDNKIGIMIQLENSTI